MILYIANSINYLSWEGLPWIISAWIGLVLFRSFATFIHAEKIQGRPSSLRN